jgi:hypothetical protein
MQYNIGDVILNGDGQENLLTILTSFLGSRRLGLKETMLLCEAAFEKTMPTSLSETPETSAAQSTRFLGRLL